MYNNDSKFVKNIFDANLGYVRMKAHDYCKLYNLPYDECEAEGRVGLAEAALHFDPSRGFTPLTYAGRFIEGRMKRLLNKEIRRRNHQADDSYESVAISNSDPYYKVDSDIRYNELLKMVQQYVDDRYYSGLAQKYLDVLELVSTGYKEREAANKCDMELSFFKKINADVRNLLRKHNYC